MTVSSATFATRASGSRFVVSGAMMVAIAMGIGRFAYTPILPLMERDVGLTVTMAGVLASTNLVGYLVGALLAMTRFARRHRLSMVRWGVAGVIATTALMASSSFLWLPLRFATGICSGFVLIFASSIVLDRAAKERQPGWPPLFFAGVGLGIAFAGLAAPPLALLGGSRASWIGLAVVSAVVVFATARWFTDEIPPNIAPVGKRVPVAPQNRAAFGWLLAIYTAEAFAYVIPATFLVAMVVAVPNLRPFAAAAWVVVGVAAIALARPWGALSAHFGKAKILVVALIVQGLGIAAPALMANALGVVCGAVALGGTFLAITGFSTGLARDMFPTNTSESIGRLTVCYSVGQIIGPAVATAVVLRTGSYAPAMLCAAAIAVLAGIVGLFKIGEPHGALL